MRFFQLLVGLVLSVSVCHGQSVKRQSIGSMGKPFYDKDISVEYSVGQPFFTRTMMTDNRKAVLSGFIQPPSYRVSRTSSSSADFRVTLYPNPAAENINFGVTGDFDDRVELVVYDISGKQVWAVSQINLTNYTIDCSSWETGTYIIRAVDSKGSMFRAKLIKTFH